MRCRDGLSMVAHLSNLSAPKLPCKHKTGGEMRSEAFFLAASRNELTAIAARAKIRVC